MRATITITLELDPYHVSSDPEEAKYDIENAIRPAASEVGEVKSLLITVQGMKRRGLLAPNWDQQ